MFVLSLGCHLALFLLIARSQLLPVFHPDEAPVTYVDMVTLPVASPQSGTPAPAAPAAQAVPTPPATPAAPKPVIPHAAMSLPAVKSKPKALLQPAPKGKIEKRAPVEDSHEFNERMAKIERLTEDKRQAEVMNRIRNKGSRVGMPGAKGTEAGSDYSSYVQSRVQDAINKVAASQSKSPMVIATITIGPDGRIADYHVEKNSGDPLFDEAVTRAVTLAGKSLRPPPGGSQFKGKFRFKPEGGGVR